MRSVKSTPSCPGVDFDGDKMSEIPVTGSTKKRTYRLSSKSLLFFEDGAPEGIRTPDLRIRSPLLYPAELQARDQIKIGLLTLIVFFVHIKYNV